MPKKGMPPRGTPEHKSLSPQQSQACLILLHDQDVDREAMDTAIEAMEQAGTLSGRAVTTLQRFVRAEGQEVTVHGSVAALCAELIRQAPDWVQVINGINDSNLSCMLGTGMMLLSGRAEVSDAVREQVMREGAGRVLAQYLRERAVRTLGHSSELNDRALTVMRDRLHDPKEDLTLWEHLVSTLARVSRKNAAARALFLGLLREEPLPDLIPLRVAQALTNMSPLETPEMEALRLAMRADMRENVRICAAQALLLAGELNVPNTEALITLLHELQAERQRESAAAPHQFKTESDQAEGEATGQEEEALAQANDREQGRHYAMYADWMRRMPWSPAQDVMKLLARIVGDREIACEMRDGALSQLANTQHGEGLEESLLAQCLRETECDASLNLQVAHLLGRREKLQPLTIAAMVEVITEKGRSPELRNKVAEAIGGNVRLQPAQAQRLFAVVQDKDEMGSLRGEIVSALTQSKYLTKPMLTLLVEWVRDTATPSELREKAALALAATNNLQRIGREALLSFLGDASLYAVWRVETGTKAARSQKLDEELVQALLRLTAESNIGEMRMYRLQSALWQSAGRDANVFQVLVAFLRNKKEDPQSRCDLAYALSNEENLPAERLSVLQAMVSDRKVAAFVRKALQYALNRNWKETD